MAAGGANSRSVLKSTSTSDANINNASLDQTDLKYIKDKTNLSFQKILDFYKTFVAKYNNGFVNREQFIDIIKRLFIDNNKDDDNSKEKLAICERLFDICDQDDDGSIDFKEYLVLFWSKVNGTSEEKLTLIFDMYDLNSSGYIDFHELHSIVKVLFKLKYSPQSLMSTSPSGVLDENSNINLTFPIIGVPSNTNLPSTYHIAMNIMRMFDCNQNAKLSKEEFVNGCLSHENIKVFLTPLKVL